MTIANIGSLGSNGSVTANQSTLVLTTTADAEAGTLVIVIVADDNRLAGADGAGSEVSGITDSAGTNTWTKDADFANNNAATQAGAAISIWRSVLRKRIPSGGTITATFTSNTLSDATGIAAHNFSFDNALQTITLEGTPGTLANDAADAGSLNVTTANVQCLRLRAIAAELGTSTNITVTAGWTAMARGSSSTTASAANMSVTGEFIISTATSAASDPTWLTADCASAYVAYRETPRPYQQMPSVTDLAPRPKHYPANLRTWVRPPQQVVDDLSTFILRIPLVSWKWQPDRVAKFFFPANIALQNPAVAMPENQYDWPVPYRVDGRTRTYVTNWVEALQLPYPTYLPPTNYDWPVPRVVSRVALTWTNANPNLLTTVEAAPAGEQSTEVPRTISRKPAETIAQNYAVTLSQEVAPSGEQSTELPRSISRKAETLAQNNAIALSSQVGAPVGEQAIGVPYTTPPKVIWHQSYNFQLLYEQFMPTSVSVLTDVRVAKNALTWINSVIQFLQGAAEAVPAGAQVTEKPRSISRKAETLTQNNTVGLSQETAPVGEQFTASAKSISRKAETWSNANVWRYPPVGDQQYDPVARTPRRPETWLQNLAQLLSSVSTTTPENNYDWPVPYRAPVKVIWHQSYNFGLLYQQFMPGAVSVWDDARERISRYAITWTPSNIAALNSTAETPPPKLNDFPVPRPKPILIPAQTLTQSSNIPLLTTPPLKPPQLNDFPVPRAKPILIPAQAWTQPTNLSLLTAPTGELPENNYDWPLPRTPIQPTSVRTWIHSVINLLSVQPVGDITDMSVPRSLPPHATMQRNWQNRFSPELLPPGDQALEVGRKAFERAVALTWIGRTAAILIEPLPFNQYDWQLLKKNPYPSTWRQINQKPQQPADIITAIPAGDNFWQFVQRRDFVAKTWIQSALNLYIPPPIPPRLPTDPRPGNEQTERRGHYVFDARNQVFESRPPMSPERRPSNSPEKRRP